MSAILEPDGFYHPTNEQDVVDLINQARSEGLILRVKGSGHSVPHAIYPDGFPYRHAEYYAPAFVANKYRLNFEPVAVPPGQLPLLLDKMRGLEFFDRGADTYVRAQAGVHLGRDPYDPTEESTHFNSLFYQMDQRGFGVPDMGGITHQTVGGFLATGSAGGSLKHSLEPAIESFRFVDGLGNVHECSRTQDPDMFSAVGVSMGLLGVVTEVTFKCTPRFDIIGEEHIRPIADYDGWIDFFGDGDGSLQDFLTTTEYSRLLWWPQKGTQKMTVWRARVMKDADYHNPNTIVVNNKTTFIPKPYQEVNWLFGSPVLMEDIGDLFYHAVAWWPTWLPKFIKGAWLRMFLQSFVETFWYGWLLPLLLSVFVPTDKKVDGKWQPQNFWDTWWRGLPMDNQMDDRLMKVVFTELWIPIEHTGAVMRALRDHYDKNGLSATGIFTCELYATNKSDFWMSPAYDKDVFRVDIFLSGNDLFDPQEYYQQFWDLLAPYSFRTHWGKWQPGTTDDANGVKKWRDYLKGLYPKWDEFLSMRNTMDPDQIFVNEYWRDRFGIPRLEGTQPQESIVWEGTTPPHLERKLKSADGKPNQALLLGRPPLPKAPVGVYITSVSYTVAFATIVEILVGNILPWCSFASTLVEGIVIGALGITIGIGVVWLRQWSPISMIIISAAMIFGANILNALLGSVLWEWHSILGLSHFWSAVITESIVSIWIPVTSWLTGKALFKKYWPA